MSESLPQSLYAFCIKQGMPDNLSIEEQCDWIRKKVYELSRKVESLQQQIDADYWPLA